MNFWSIVYNILIGPLKLLFEVIYSKAYAFLQSPGLSIIVLSLAMNILVLPLYKRADALQEEERDLEAKLREGITHIKKTFKGDEKMMMLETYYRQNNYSPLFVLRGSVSLFLQIPFFIAAYQFLSKLELLKGTSFAFIKDLGAADGLLVIGGVSVNLLPFVMTAVNLISGFLYSRDYPLKTKIQLYAMALFFLVFLYKSPSGLVFYWTLNNVFSLGKTIVHKLRPAKVPMEKKVSGDNEKTGRRLFIICALYLAFLTGFVIPSGVIASSPQEFVDIRNYFHPLWYVISALSFAIGTFLVWVGVFYRLAGPKGKRVFEVGILGVSLVCSVDYLFYGMDTGMLTNTLMLQKGLLWNGKEKVLNLLVVVALLGLGWTAVKWFKKWTPKIVLVIMLAFFVIGVMNVKIIAESISELGYERQAVLEEEPYFTLSKNGKNVVVIMMDRAIGWYAPYIFEERPDLKKSFSGFTYYYNTASFAGFTNMASPALFGGYEYTPEEMNKRDNELIPDKHNEALKVLPVLFDKEGYKVTVMDVPYANYQWIPDLSIYDEYPNINKFISNGYFSGTDNGQAIIEKNKRNFFCYSLFKCAPLALQGAVYDNGRYNSLAPEKQLLMEGQVIDMEDPYRAEGISPAFMEAYTTLEHMDMMTNVVENGNTFLVFDNETTHDTMMLQEPGYLPTIYTDNETFEIENRAKFSVDGVELAMKTADQSQHYQANMAAYVQLAKWFDYLRKEGVWDNTRIILVSDHGRELFGQISDDYLIDGINEDLVYDYELYLPLLMVKDFDSKEFTVNNEFMTNADTPTLAVDGLIENPVNPFTGNPINSAEKNPKDMHVFGSGVWNIEANNGYTYYEGPWFSVHDEVHDLENWDVIK